MPKFPVHLLNVRHAASPANHRYAISNIELTFAKDKDITAAATDGRILAIARAAPFEEINKDEMFQIPGETAKFVLSNISLKDQDYFVEIHRAEGDLLNSFILSFKSKLGAVISINVEFNKSGGRFPEWRKLEADCNPKPDAKKAPAFAVKHKVMVDACSVLKPFFKLQPLGSDGLVIYTPQPRESAYGHEQDKPLVIGTHSDGFNGNITSVKLIIMPMRPIQGSEFYKFLEQCEVQPTTKETI
jgi:hypothetical protein